MASGKKKLLMAGLLTAVAAGAFYTFSGDKTPSAPPQQQTVDVQALIQKADSRDYIRSDTKDGHVLHIYVDVPQLATGGKISDAELAKDIRTQSRLGIYRGMGQWNKAEIPNNISSIENDLALFLGNNVTIGVDGNGALIPAQEGVNFGAPTVQKIVDEKTDQVLYQKGPTAAPAIVAPAMPKPPGT